MLTTCAGTVRDYPMNQKQPQGEKSPHDEVWYSTPDQSTERKNSKQRVNQTHEEQKASRKHGNKEKDLKLEQKLKEENCDITCGSSNRETEQKEERCSSLGGAKNFFLGKAEEYTVCEQYFSLSNFHVRN